MEQGRRRYIGRIEEERRRNMLILPHGYVE
jgi:hypothetical protein